MKNVLIVDTGISNVPSLASALEHLGAKFQVISTPTSNPPKTNESLILPGVGNFSVGAEKLHATGLSRYISECVKLDIKILGICLGMQLLCVGSSESPESQGMSIINTNLERFSLENGSKTIQHVGFNQVSFLEEDHPLFRNLPNASDFYFTHSYKVPLANKSFELAQSFNSTEGFASVVTNGRNVYGVQFHPEKSQTNGLLILKNFLEI